MDLGPLIGSSFLLYHATPYLEPLSEEPSTPCSIFRLLPKDLQSPWKAPTYVRLCYVFKILGCLCILIYLLFEFDHLLRSFFFLFFIDTIQKSTSIKGNFVGIKFKRAKSGGFLGGYFAIPNYSSLPFYVLTSKS
jgi:hypothetical protein